MTDETATCPRRIMTAKGKTRVVRCRLWSCPTCAANKRVAMIAAARRTFAPPGVAAFMIRAQQDGHHDDIVHVWARIRSRFPGMRYIAVREPSPDAHLHALITHVHGDSLKAAALSCGAFECDIEPIRSVPAYIDYLLDKRQDRRAVRITHSRDLTSSLSRDGDANEIRKEHHAEEESPNRSDEARRRNESPDEETFTTREGFTPPEEAQREASCSTASPAPAIVADNASDVRQRNELEALIAAARSVAQITGTNITITITVTP